MSQIPTDAHFVSTYRAGNIYRRPRKKSADGRQYWTYFSVVEDQLLVSWTLSGIKTQIGRVLNGLKPCDCNSCAYQIPETPVSPKHCGKALHLTGPYFVCEGFETGRR